MKQAQKAAPEGEAQTADASEPGEGLLELIVAEHEARVAREVEPRPERIDGVLVGRIVAIEQDGSILVHHRFAARAEGEAARAIAAVTPDDVGREVALVFEGGAPDRPIIMGLMNGSTGATANVRAAGADVEADGERLVFSADKEIVLRCGEASITLTRAGKILIRGAFLLAHASGVNRIVGGSVEIN